MNTSGSYVPTNLKTQKLWFWVEYQSKKKGELSKGKYKMQLVYIRLVIFTARKIMTPCSLLDSYQHYGRTCYTYLLDRREETISSYFLHNISCYLVIEINSHSHNSMVWLIRVGIHLLHKGEWSTPSDLI